jgi:RHS repeat-associated protein
MRNVEGHGFSHAAKPQIRSRKVDGGTTNTYVYNSRGMRAGLAGGENLFDLNGNIVSVVTPGTATLAYNRYTVGGRLLAANLSGTTDFYHQDWLGGIRAGSSLSGSLLDSCTNLPFGDGTNNCGLWYFAGLMSDPWDTLNTSATRSQSPTSGRWLTPDPAGMAAMDLSNPQTWNRYAYVTNNPVSATDPSGLDEDDDGGGNGDIYTGSSPGMINPSNPTSFQLWNNLPTVGGVYGRNGAASEAAYASWVNAIWQAGGSVFTHDGGVPIALNWTIDGGVYGINQANGDTLDAEDLSEFIGPAGSDSQGAANNITAGGCSGRVLSAVNNHFGTSFTSANITGEFQFSTGAPKGQGTLNLDISGGGVSPGRYPVNWWTYIIGYGSTLHIPAGPGGLDSPLTLPFSNSQFTAHLDSAFAYNPIGAVIHLLTNLGGIGGYKPCP